MKNNRCFSFAKIMTESNKPTALKLRSSDKPWLANQKVLIISTKFRWYSESFADAFRQCGCDVTLHEESLRIEKSDIKRYIKYRLHLASSKDYEEIREEINKRVLEKYNQCKPDLFVVVMGNQITPDTLKIINKSCKTVVLLSDTREKYPYYDCVVPFYSKVYTYELSDLEYYKSIGVNVDALYGLVDEKQYYPIKNCNKNIDLCFVGFMNEERKKILEQLYRDFPELRMEFWGQYLTSHNPIKFLKWFFTRKRKVFKNKVIHYSKVNQIYNSSKICLNLNGVLNVNGWGSRLAEILGTCSFQIAKGNSIIDSEFEKCLVTYGSYEELKKQINEYLNDEKSRSIFANNGYNKVINNFTYKKAAQRILEDKDF